MVFNSKKQSPFILRSSLGSWKSLVSLRFQKHPPQTFQKHESLRRRDGWFWKIDLLENWSRFFVQLKRSKPRKGRKTMTLRNRQGCFGYHFPFIKACNPKDPTFDMCNKMTPKHPGCFRKKTIKKKQIDAGNEIRHPKESLDPPFLRGLDLYYAGFFRDLQTTGFLEIPWFLGQTKMDPSNWPPGLPSILPLLLLSRVFPIEVAWQVGFRSTLNKNHSMNQLP